jgi:hypothetical protein
MLPSMPITWKATSTTRVWLVGARLYPRRAQSSRSRTERRRVSRTPYLWANSITLIYDPDEHTLRVATQGAASVTIDRRTPTVRR